MSALNRVGTRKAKRFIGGGSGKGGEEVTTDSSANINQDQVTPPMKIVKTLPN